MFLDVFFTIVVKSPTRQSIYTSRLATTSTAEIVDTS